MDTGKRRRVMIACVTFETYKITNPIDYYETQIAHIIHYVRNMNSESDRQYLAFYDRVCQLIKNSNPECKIIEHLEDVTNFQKMLMTVDSIVKDEYLNHPNSDIFINISAGTSEYVAAATIGSMMYKNTIPFAVKTKKYTISGEDAIVNAYFRDGIPIGLAEETFDPTTVPKISIRRPEERLVKGLMILRSTYDNNPAARASEIIDNLKKGDVWIRDSDNRHGAALSRYNLVYYHRDFVDKWEDLGWVVKDKTRQRYYITQEGDRIIATFNN